MDFEIEKNVFFIQGFKFIIIRVRFGSLIINNPLIIKTTCSVYYLVGGAYLVLGGEDYSEIRGYSEIIILVQINPW